MQMLVSLVAVAVVLIAVLGAIQFTVLAFRNPFRPAWLGDLDNVAAVMIAAAVSLSFGYGITALVDSGLPPFAAIAAVVAIILGAAYAIWRLFDCRERLKRADAGQSPFYGLTRPLSVPGAGA